MNSRLHSVNDNNPSPLMTKYESLLTRTHRMLGHAERGEWQELIEEETAYCGDMERIRQLELEAHLSEDQLWRKATLLERILEHSATLKELLNDRRQVLGLRLHEAEQRSKKIDQYLDWHDAG